MAQNSYGCIIYTYVLIHHKQKESEHILYYYLLIKAWMEQYKTIVVDGKAIAIDPDLTGRDF